MKKIRNENGITLIALVITVIVLFIIAGISIMKGTDLVNTSKAETIETNMLTIKAKAKEYMENVDAKTWATNQKDKENKNREELTGKYKLTLIEDVSSYINNSEWYQETDTYTYYSIEKVALDNMGLSEMYEEGKIYIIKYPQEPTSGSRDADLKLDIIYANGIEYKGRIYYNLSNLENAL